MSEQRMLHLLAAPADEECAAAWDAGRERATVARAKVDRAAFAALYDHYLAPVYRYCLLRLESREAAEDATSQVFTRALASLDSCRDETFGGWPFAIARSVVTDQWRKNWPTRPLEEAEVVPDPGPSPEETAISHDEREWLQTMLRQLVPDQREVVELRMAGLSGKEIARAMDRRLGAVKMLQSRALARLRVLLAAEMDAAPTTRSDATTEEGHHASTR
ncbi:MAG: RNA polymerase sigma factor [Thermomicrobiales bacterium]